MIYLDTNDLCGNSLMQLLPTEIFNWVNPKDFNKDSYSNDSSMGCFLEFNLDYLDKLYDLDNDYLLAGEKAKVTKQMLRPNINYKN